MAGFFFNVGDIDVATANRYTDELVRKLENEFQSFYRINISEIVKGGSLGHGTAVPGKFDLDLVLYSRDIHARDVIANGVKDVLNKLDMFLQSQYGSHDYKKKKITPFALQFTLYQKLDVDLLPSPFWSSSHEFINFMEGLSQQNRRNEAKWEKLFFQRQPNAVKEYTKRAKKWRERCWNEGVSGTGRPKSILLGLLVAEAYRKVGWNDPRAITRKLQEIVKSHHYMKIHWINDGAIYSQARCDTPYLMDPANPFNNLYISGIHSYRGGNIREDRYNEGDGNWTNMVRYIDQLDLSRD